MRISLSGVVGSWRLYQILDTVAGALANVPAEPSPHTPMKGEQVSSTSCMDGLLAPIRNTSNPRRSKDPQGLSMCGLGLAPPPKALKADSPNPQGIANPTPNARLALSRLYVSLLEPSPQAHCKRGHATSSLAAPNWCQADGVALGGGLLKPSGVTSQSQWRASPHPKAQPQASSAAPGQLVQTFIPAKHVSILFTKNTTKRPSGNLSLF